MRSEQISARCIALIENMVGATTYKNMRAYKVNHWGENLKFNDVEN